MATQPIVSIREVLLETIRNQKTGQYGGSTAAEQRFGSGGASDAREARHIHRRSSPN
jgi:hypothetical protein